MATRVASSTMATASATLPHAHAHGSHHTLAKTTRGVHHSTSSIQVPNRFTQAFQEMKQVCPQSISLYASCVLEAERSGHSIEKHSCSKEFRQVKDCFRKVRGV